MIISQLTPKKGSFFTRLEVKKCVEHNNIINPLMDINKLQGFYLYTLVDYQAVTILEIYLYMDK